ncbi:MAG TPA: MarR family transcriptional regulator [Gemmatimonadaceae bacterium]|nr:MarR family transcriptional regulator [Gemmatimonadaceae bacterium]
MSQRFHAMVAPDTGTGRTRRAGGRASPFETPQLHAFDLLLRTASELDQQVARLLKPAAVTPAQYNVLRILRGAGGAGLPCGEISERLVRHDPDVTRLLDRLEAQGFVARSRDSEDRRVVIARITGKGVELLDSLGESIAALHARQFGALGRDDFRALVALLHELRGAER